MEGNYGETEEDIDHSPHVIRCSDFDCESVRPFQYRKLMFGQTRYGSNIYDRSDDRSRKTAHMIRMSRSRHLEAGREMGD